MNQLLNLAGTIIDLALVVVGFGFIIFIHELGHFLAARWAGIRVLAFAIGFGGAALSYRKGMGWRRGSSEREYLERCRVGESAPKGISPTEYRFNWLPFGGYVKMLGQDDTNPAAVSDAPDSYQSCRPWKRMVVISAGVVMNMILAAALFVGVFMYGLKTEPAKIGVVIPGSPASRATPADGRGGVGLHPGDEVVSLNGRRPNSFNDLILATAMTEPGGVLRIGVRRPGEKEELRYEVHPEPGPVSGLPELGVEPARSNRILSARTDAEFRAGSQALAARGLPGVEPGMRLISLSGITVSSGADAHDIVRSSEGRKLEAVFGDDSGGRVSVRITPRAELQLGQVLIGPKTYAVVNHLLGLSPVLRVAPARDPSRPRQGLEDGDIFARIGSVEFPGAADGVAEIRAHKGREIPVTVLRAGPEGRSTLVRLTPSPTVRSNGVIGFERSDTASVNTMVSMPPARIVDNRNPAPGAAPAAAAIIRRPGSRIVEVAGTPVADFSEIRAALREATRGARASSGGAAVDVLIAPPSQPGQAAGELEVMTWPLSAAEVEQLHSLGWTSNLDTDLFEPEQFVLQARGPLDALRMGVAETHRVMMTTYVTFARLFQGSVKVEHLKGPVGIAHLGTRIAERGIVWLLFFMGLISVNLAVINFLPLPIVDGGQFLFLLIEQIRGKPVPIAIQNIATIAGMMLIGAVFLIVTFHDIANLFG